MDKYRSLVSNTIIFAIGTFSSKLLSFLMVRFYTGILTPEQYSTSDLIAQSANFLIPLATLSAAESVIRFGLDEKYDKTKIFTTGVFTVLMGMAGLAVLFPLVNLVHKFDGYAFLLYAYVYISGFKQMCSQFVRARGLVKLFAFDGILTTFSLILLNILFLAGFHWGAGGYVLSIIVSDLLSILFLCWMAGLGKFWRPSCLNSKLFRKMLHYSAPLIPTAVLWIVISVSDRFFVAYMMGDAENGMYTAANKIPMFLGMASTIFSQAWQISAFTEKDPKAAGKFYTRVFAAFQAGMFVVTGGILLFLKPISSLLLAENFRPAYIVSPLLLLGVLMMCFCNFLASAYSATKHTVNSLVTSSLAAAVNLFLNAVLIPKWGLQGAAVATLASYFSCMLVRLVDARRYVPFRAGGGRMFVNLAALGGMTALTLTQAKLLYL